MKKYAQDSGGIVWSVNRERQKTMIGYKKRAGDKEIFIGISLIPNRKKMCLVVKEGNTLTKYATFNNDEAAMDFMNIFAEFIGAEKIEWFEREG